MISLIAAMAKNRVIGYHGTMPWHMPADLKFFKKNTLNKPIIMGRKTFETLGAPLPKRRNLVVTRQALQFDDCEVFHSLQSAINAANDASEIMIIGGGHIYREALAFADRLYLTFIDVEIEGDTFFPVWNPNEWQEVFSESHKADTENPYPYRFVILDRLSVA